MNEQEQSLLKENKTHDNTLSSSYSTKSIQKKKIKHSKASFTGFYNYMIY